MPKMANGYWSDRMSERHRLAVKCCLDAASTHGINLVDAFATGEQGRLRAQQERVNERNTIFRHMLARGFEIAEIARACEVDGSVVSGAVRANGWTNGAKHEHDVRTTQGK